MESSESSSAAASSNTEVKPPSLLELYRYCESYKKYLAFGVIFSILSGACFPAFAELLGDIFGIFMLPEDELRPELLKSSATLSAFGVLFFVSVYVGSVCFCKMAELAVQNLRMYFFSSMMKKPVAFFDTHNVADIVAKMSEHSSTITDGYGDKPGTAVTFFFQFVFSAYVAISNSWRVSLAMLVIAPIQITAEFLGNKLMYQASVQGNKDTQESSAYAQQVLDSLSTVKAFSLESDSSKRFSILAKNPFKSGLKRSRTEGLMHALVYGLVLLSYASSLYISGYFVSKEIVSPAEVLSVFFAVVFGMMGIAMTGAQMPDIMKAKAAAKELIELIDEPNDELNESGLNKDLKGHIRLDNVTFRYPSRPDVVVLDNFSLEVEPHTTVALVGTSGGGKSTIINLLQRFCLAEKGDVVIDGTSLSEFNLTAFRRQVALVEQQPKLFSGTIKENILFGLFGTGLKYSDEELEAKVIDASKKANAYNFIMDMPNGFDTTLNEGTELSGGQLQRISIARALIRDPKILLLDEPTSALDSESERMVQEVLDEMMSSLSCTMIVIAHRLSTVRNADKIAVINRGLIAEGTHEELLETSEDYRKLTKGQLIGFADKS
ncbi:hypothetical protein GEMRC1_004660 [Eukaryota sp. GEM-RC1]